MIQETLDMFKVCEKYKHERKHDIPSMPGIFLQDVSFTFEGRKTPLFKHLRLYIPEGQTVLIVGHIGSGKSTLVRLLMKYAEPDDGDIYIHNIPYSKMKACDLRRLIGYVPQNPILFNRTVYENITYGLPYVSREDVTFLINDLELASVLPSDLDSSVGKYGSKVSGGQRQVIWILRTILQNPSIVLMDEPTSSMDEVTKAKIHKAMSLLMKDKTVVMVTHDSYLMQYATRVIEMDHGAIIADVQNKNKNKQ
jgi:ABC-type multidrug transport system fused ATPase/permease subunit